MMQEASPWSEKHEIDEEPQCRFKKEFACGGLLSRIIQICPWLNASVFGKARFPQYLHGFVSQAYHMSTQLSKLITLVTVVNISSRSFRYFPTANQYFHSCANFPYQQIISAPRSSEISIAQEILFIGVGFCSYQL